MNTHTFRSHMSQVRHISLTHTRLCGNGSVMADDEKTLCLCVQVGRREGGMLVNKWKGRWRGR